MNAISHFANNRGMLVRPNQLRQVVSVGFLPMPCNELLPTSWSRCSATRAEHNTRLVVSFQLGQATYYIGHQKRLPERTSQSLSLTAYSRPGRCPMLGPPPDRRPIGRPPDDETKATDDVTRPS